VGDEIVARLATGELLLQFEVAWPAGEDGILAYIGAGPYHYSAGDPLKWGMSQHLVYPVGHFVSKTGTVTFY
jgi:hypothetical protein